MSNFLFDGRSRQTKMSFASDHRPTRDHLLLEAQQRRQKREEDLRRNAAALKVQRAVRQWLACRRVACLAYTAILRLDNNNNNNGNAHIEPLSSSSSSSAHAIPERLAHACWCQQFLRSNAVKMSAHSWGAVVMSEGISTGGGGGSVPWTPDAVLHRCSSIIGSALRGILQPPPGGGLSIPVADIPLRVLSAAVVMLLDDFGRTVQQQQQLQSTVDTARVISSLTTMQDLVHSCVRAAPSRAASSSGDALTDAAECIAFKSLLYCAQYLSHCPDARLEIADLVCPLLEADLVQFTCSDLAASDGCVDVDNEEEREAEAKKLLSCLISRKADEASSSVLLSGSRRTTWTEVCLACLAAPSTLEYMPLTDNPLFALISIAPTREIVNSGSWCIRAVEGIVRAGYYGIVQHPELLIGRHGEWESRAMVALGRLTRLLPVFLPQAPGTTFTTTDGALLLVRKAWMQCIGTLCEGLCQTEVFVQTILYDLHHRSEGHYGAGGRYRHLVSHLFSSEGGLRLLELVAMSEDATTTPATVPSHVSDDVQLSALNTISSIEIACSMYAWPLFSFSLASSTHRLETSAVFAKLIRTPPLLRQLWRLYSNRCEGIHALLQGADGEGGVLHKLCLKACTPDVTVRLPVWQTAPPALLSSLSGTRVKHMAFWDPQPATSALFFTLFSYYLDVTDFAEDLKRDTVLTHRECWALLFALKEIVHRSHMHGVVPSSNSEAVAHLAYLLLGKLHAINESSAIVPYPSIWVSITDEATLLTLGSVTPEMWEELSLRHEAALKALVSKVEGASSSSVPGSEHGDEEASPAKAIGLKHSSQQLPGDDLLFDGSLSWSMEERIVYLLMHAPFLLPFPQRAALLSMLLLSQQPQRVPGLPQTFVAHRGRTFVDAYDRFHEQPDSTQMFAVRFASESGMVEEGYGHGVYREFMVSVCREGLAVEYGLFRQTEDGFVFPNNFSLEATGDPLHLRKINFLGTMVGRALRDGILQDVPFALHFRNALLGRRNSINNLKSFDPELYQQLLALTKLGKEDLDAIGMTFSYTVTSLGITKEVELIKGGAEVFVTPHNCLHYIHLVADYKLNREGRPQTYAFQSGLESIIQHSWLSLFDSNELLNLFGGDQSGKIDISDWKQHTVYKNPDDVQSVPVRLFWEVVESLSNEQQRKLLQFATSMNRPPLLGFRFLSPPFNVHILADNTIDRLPSASTCFSMLKLPPYKDYASARAKIIAAIEESNSFGLT